MNIKYNQQYTATAGKTNAARIVMIKFCFLCLAKKIEVATAATVNMIAIMNDAYPSAERFEKFIKIPPEYMLYYIILNMRCQYWFLKLLLIFVKKCKKIAKIDIYSYNNYSYEQKI